YIEISRLPIERRCLLQVAYRIEEAAQLVQSVSLACEVILAHFDRQRLAIGLLGGFRLTGVLMNHTDLVPDLGYLKWLAQRGEGIPSLLVDFQCLTKSLLKQPHGAKLEFSHGSSSKIVQGF